MFQKLDHYDNSPDNLGKLPRDGQQALNESILVKIKGDQKLETRVGVENGKVVIFHEHVPGDYHGYIETGKIEGLVEAALKDAGLMSKSGKIK